MKIRGREISPDVAPYLVAEVGVNHQGEMAVARELIIAAARSDAEAVKFQGFTPTKRGLPDRENVDEIRRLALSPDQMAALAKEAHELNLAFILSPFDPAWVTACAPFVDAWKVAASRNRDTEVGGAVLGTGKPYIVSLGMTTAAERERSALLAMCAPEPPVLLHCVSAYPCGSPHLAAITKLLRLGAPLVGYSDHTGRQSACAAAVALRACLVEVHVTFSRTASGPDHGFSFSPSELQRLAECLLQTWHDVNKPGDDEGPCKQKWRRA